MLRLVALLIFVQPAYAESVVATRTIRAKTLIAPEDLTLVSAELPGALVDPALAIGQEAKVSIYAGKPVKPSDYGPPTLVQRNQLVTLIYSSGGLSIATEGRALFAPGWAARGPAAYGGCAAGAHERGGRRHGRHQGDEQGDARHEHGEAGEAHRVVASSASSSGRAHRAAPLRAG